MGQFRLALTNTLICQLKISNISQEKVQLVKVSEIDKQRE